MGLCGARYVGRIVNSSVSCFGLFCFYLTRFADKSFAPDLRIAAL